MQDIRALLADTRLSREARIMGLHVATLGDGEHQVSHESFRVILGRGAHGLAKDDTLAGYVQELVSHGWVTRRSGGQGSPIYTFTPLSAGGSLPPHQSVYPPIGVLPPLQGGGKEAVYPPLRVGENPPSSSSTEPPPPPPPPLDARAREWVESSEVLKGARDSLLDYLHERVDPSRHLAYVQTVVGMIEGTDERLWKGRNGSDRITDGRSKIVAGCLNELRQGDEVGRYFPGPPGDVRNLQSKIRYKVKSETDAKRDEERRSQSDGAAAAARGEPRAGRPASPVVHIER